MKVKEILIQGYIGFPEWWQFDESMRDQVVSTKEKMRNELKDIANAKVDKINVKIDSFGGDVNHALAIYNALKESKAEIETEFIGFSASAATIIGAAGTTKITDNLLLLYHESRTISLGTKSQLEADVKMLNDVNNNIAEIYSRKSGRTKDEMLDLISRNGGEGEWLTAIEAKELGLVDEVYEPSKMAASYEFDNELLLKMKLPEIPKNKIESIINNKKQENKMGLFSKDKKPVNKITLGKVDAVYQGELKEGVELAGIGSDVPNGNYEVDDNIYTVENSVISKIENKQPEMFTKDQVDIQVKNAVDPLNSKISELEASNESLTVQAATDAEKIKALEAENAELKKLTSKHVPPQSKGVENKPQEVENFQSSIVMETRKAVAEKVKERKQK